MRFCLLVVSLVSFNVSVVFAGSDLQVVQPEMITIPGGSYEMGCVSGIDCNPREEPIHKVTVSTFEISKTEVTVELWAACVEAKGCDYVPADDGWIEPGMPVRYVSWDDVQVFLLWLNSETGSNYRLPTEAEWEYAARAGTDTPFSTGNCITPDQANSEGDTFKIAGCEHESQNRKRAIPVASFKPNAFGLYDMHGNVWEWVQDCYHPNYDDAPADGSAWLGTATECERHVMRGGTWHGTVSYMRSAFRFRYPGKIRTGGLGFRLARSIE